MNLVELKPQLLIAEQRLRVIGGNLRNNGTSDGSKHMSYVGQAKNCSARIREHQEGKI